MSDGDGPVGKDSEADGTLIADDNEVSKTAKAMVEFDVVEQRFLPLNQCPQVAPLSSKNPHT